MVGGTVIEALPMRITAGFYPGKATDVVRLWCIDGSDELAVYADASGDLPSVGDEIWWQSGMIMFDRDMRRVRKIGYSFDPRNTDEN